MASIRQLRRRMKTIKNIHEITKAMEMIAAFRFKKAENRFSRSRFYFSELKRLFASLAESNSSKGNPLFEKRDIRIKTLVVMTGDKGLCGSYNSMLIKKTLAWLEDNKSYQTRIFAVGKIGCDFFQKRGLVVQGLYVEKAKADLDMAKEITLRLKELFLNGQTDSVEILYNELRLGGTGFPVMIPFLSLNHLMSQTASKRSETQYIYEPSAAEVFDKILESYMEGQIYNVLLESLASELCARMVAMKQATENGEEVMDSLKLLMNKTRQATITRELSEIVSGASVLV